MHEHPEMLLTNIQLRLCIGKRLGLQPQQVLEALMDQQSGLQQLRHLNIPTLPTSPQQVTGMHAVGGPT